MAASVAPRCSPVASVLSPTHSPCSLTNQNLFYLFYTVPLSYSVFPIGLMCCSFKFLMVAEGSFGSLRAAESHFPHSSGTSWLVF